MTARYILVKALALIWLSAIVHAESPITTSQLARYPEIKTQFNQSLSRVSSDNQILNVYRRNVARGRHSGTPMLLAMFGNFEPGKFNLNPSTPGLDKAVRQLASDNQNVVTGTARTLRYAMSLANDQRFTVVGINRPRANSLGVTDADIVFRHNPTGLQGRIEVKHMSPTSQRANFEKIRMQILKMAEDGRTTGEVQVWANRHSVIPEIHDLGKRHGVMVVERLRTGNTSVHRDDRRFQEFADVLDRDLRYLSRVSAVFAGVNAGMGIYLSQQAIRDLEIDIAAFDGTNGNWLRLGEHGSRLLAGGSIATAGLAEFVSKFPGVVRSGRLVPVTRWGTRLGIVATLMGEAFLIGQYMNGDLTSRQFWHGQANLAGALGGSVAGSIVGAQAGALIGGLIGSLAGPAGTAMGAGIGAKIGALFGGILGGYLGSNLASNSVEAYFHWRDIKQHEDYVRYLEEFYGSYEGRKADTVK